DRDAVDHVAGDGAGRDEEAGELDERGRQSSGRREDRRARRGRGQRALHLFPCAGDRDLIFGERHDRRESTPLTDTEAQRKVRLIYCAVPLAIFTVSSTV